MLRLLRGIWRTTIGWLLSSRHEPTPALREARDALPPVAEQLDAMRRRSEARLLHRLAAHPEIRSAALIDDATPATAVARAHGLSCASGSPSRSRWVRIGHSRSQDHFGSSSVSLGD